MKKILLSVYAIIGFSILSQAQIKFGIKAGGNLTNQRINVTSGNMYAAGERFKGYHAGVIADINLGKNFYLQPQLLFSRKGASHFSSFDSLQTKVRMSYIEFPVNVLYKAAVSFGNVFVGTGATFSYAVGGNEQQGGVTKKIYSGPVKNWKRQEISLDFTAGLEFNNGFFASINYQKGLIDIYKTDGVSIKNRLFSVSIGYLVGLKK